jgi:hypothetical protein
MKQNKERVIYSKFYLYYVKLNFVLKYFKNYQEQKITIMKRTMDLPTFSIIRPFELQYGVYCNASRILGRPER